MDTFVKRFQPDKYEDWKEGKDLAAHPEDDQKKLYKHRLVNLAVNILSIYGVNRRKNLWPKEAPPEGSHG